MNVVVLSLYQSLSDSHCLRNSQPVHTVLLHNQHNSPMISPPAHCQYTTLTPCLFSECETAVGNAFMHV